MAAKRVPLREYDPRPAAPASDRAGRIGESANDDHRAPKGRGDPALTASLCVDDSWSQVHRAGTTATPSGGGRTSHGDAITGRRSSPSRWSSWGGSSAPRPGTPLFVSNAARFRPEAAFLAQRAEAGSGEGRYEIVPTRLADCTPPRNPRRVASFPTTLRCDRSCGAPLVGGTVAPLRRCAASVRVDGSHRLPLRVSVPQSRHLVEPPPAARVLRHRNVHVGVQPGIVGVDEALLDDRVIEALARGDHAPIRLREGGSGMPSRTGG